MQCGHDEYLLILQWWLLGARGCGVLSIYATRVCGVGVTAVSEVG